MLLAVIDGVGDDVAGGLAQHVFLRHATDLLRYRLRSDDLDDMMIEKRARGPRSNAPSPCGRRAWSGCSWAACGLGPQIERLVQRRRGRRAGRGRRYRSAMPGSCRARRNAALKSARTAMAASSPPAPRRSRSTTGRSRAARSTPYRAVPLRRRAGAGRARPHWPASSSSSSRSTSAGSCPCTIVEQHVAAEMRIAAEDLVRALAGDDDLVAGIAHRAAQQIFGHAVGVEAERLAVRRWHRRNDRPDPPA